LAYKVKSLPILYSEKIEIDINFVFFTIQAMGQWLEPEPKLEPQHVGVFLELKNYAAPVLYPALTSIPWPE
jgi:hypothetical protein